MWDCQHDWYVSKVEVVFAALRGDALPGSHAVRASAASAASLHVPLGSDVDRGPSWSGLKNQDLSYLATYLLRKETC